MSEFLECGGDGSTLRAIRTAYIQFGILFPMSVDERCTSTVCFRAPRDLLSSAERVVRATFFLKSVGGLSPM
jgi:hypothetical protein